MRDRVDVTGLPARGTALPPTALLPGDAAPWFRAAVLDGNPSYVFDTAAGRPILMLFNGSGGWPAGAAAIARVMSARALFDDRRASFFGVTADPEDAAEARIATSLPGIRWFLDYDGALATAYGALTAEGTTRRYQPCWLLLDRRLRVVRTAPLQAWDEIVHALEALILEDQPASHAPILTVPNVFEPELCRELITWYDRRGGTPSGFMREEGDRTVEKFAPHHKLRRDCLIDDEGLMHVLGDRLSRALRPQIRRAFQFDSTRIERWLVACYDGASGGHFRPHRDNTTKGTEHRRFACTINLNADDYDGGDLRFPEFGSRTYRAPTGGAVVFSCSLLHEAMPVEQGKRYAFLPFLYDEAGAALRERNQHHLSPSLRGYRAERSGRQ